MIERQGERPTIEEGNRAPVEVFFLQARTAMTNQNSNW